MLSIMLAVSALSAPVGAETFAITSCAPAEHTACSKPEARAEQVGADAHIRVGKRCHPDSTKAMGCREILADRTRRPEAAAAPALAKAD